MQAPNAGVSRSGSEGPGRGTGCREGGGSVAINSAQAQLTNTRGMPGQTLAAGSLGWNGVMALSVLQSLPVFAMFLIFREQIVRGVKITGRNG